MKIIIKKSALQESKGDVTYTPLQRSGKRYAHYKEGEEDHYLSGYEEMGKLERQSKEGTPPWKQKWHDERGGVVGWMEKLQDELDNATRWMNDTLDPKHRDLLRGRFDRIIEIGKKYTEFKPGDLVAWIALEAAREKMEEPIVAMGEMEEQTEPFQKKVKAKHKRMKFRLIGKGKGKHVASSYEKKPSYERSKSAPPAG